MPKMYLANVTQQNQVVNYRLSESNKVWTQPISIGKQILVGKGDDMAVHDIESVIAQLSPYGLISVDELRTTRKQVTWLYSLGRPVKADQIQAAALHNKGVLTDQGRKFREHAAIATNQAMDAAADDAGLTRAGALEMSVEEESGEHPDGDKPVGEGYRLDKTAARAKMTRGRRKAA